MSHQELVLRYVVLVYRVLRAYAQQWTLYRVMMMLMCIVRPYALKDVSRNYRYAQV